MSQEGRTPKMSGFEMEIRGALVEGKGGEGGE
jgi:hypothetical protein